MNFLLSFFGIMLRFNSCKRVITATILLLALYSNSVFGQGVVRGKVTDNNGEAMIGAAIVLKSNPGYGTITDFDGNYSIKITDTSPQVLIISYVSYKSQELTVNPKGGEVIVKNIILQANVVEGPGVEITGKVVKSNDVYVEEMKKKSATTIDVISSLTMKKTGDANVTAAVARVAGVSTNGAFITVRGIGDRYVKTALNGSRIPTLDPFTNNIKLDLFPSSLIDNVIISKTATPELPGDWAGAYLSVETKDYPEELSVNVESAFGYNNQATFKNVISSDRSKTDWLGFDNSLRDRNHEGFTNAITSPSSYQQFVALGLADYYNSLGVTEDNWYTNSENYIKLGLVQLGLLAPALFNDATAVQQAKSDFISLGYASTAFQEINKDVPSSGKSFANNWNVLERQAPLNFSQNISVGNQIDLFGKPLGFIAGIRYQSSNQYDAVSKSNRASVSADSSGGYVNSVASALTQQSGIETNGWNALLSGSYKYHKNHSFSFLFMPNFIGTNRVRKSYDTGDKTTVATLSQFYEQRKQSVYQFKSENFIAATKIKIETNLSYTIGRSSTPDFKNLQYWINPDSTLQIGGAIGDGMHRYYRYLDDDMIDGKVMAELPISKKPFLVRKLKFGGSYQRNDQKFDQYDYFILTGPQIGPLLNEDINAFLSPAQFGIINGTDNSGIPYSTINAYYQELGSPANHTFGHASVYGAFLMCDYSVDNFLRISGGLRYEQAYVFTDVVSFHEKGYVKNDPRRVYSDGLPIANPGSLSQSSFLPSLNLVYKLNAEESHPVNLRANYSRTLARPGIRELSDVAVLDYELRAPVYGNSELKPVRIDNYDLRWESYFRSGNNITISAFHKEFRNHIELINANGYTWQNVDRSKVSGVELEGKLVVSKKLECASNITLVKSATTFVRTRFDLSNGIKQFIPIDTLTRTMYGQSPYVLNAVITYKLDSIGLTLTAGYNVQGPRLVISSNIKEIPDVFEMPRHMIDIKASKKLGKHFSASLTVKDLLNTPVRRSYDYAEGFSVLDYDSYRYGTNYILTFGYKL